MKSILEQAKTCFDTIQCENLKELLINNLNGLDIITSVTSEESTRKANSELLSSFISAKKIEGGSAKTLKYYENTIIKMFSTIKKPVAEMSTNDIRTYLAEYQEERHLSKVTVDNIRRIFSSFFSWLEDEDLILKSPVRRIHKVRTDTLVKETITDEQLEQLRDNCTEIRDLALIDLLASTGMRVGELVRMNRNDLNFHERQCIVFGKGNKEREVYFNARTKIHLQQYLDTRTDTNPALFVSLSKPNNRLTISGVEVRLRTIGNSIGLNKIHPHKFRRTLATMAIDKGMPIEQVQCILGHVKIDTTLHYAKVNQVNVKMSHRKCICLKKVDSQKESIIMTPHTEFQKKYYQQVIEIHQKTGFSPRKIAKLQLVPVSVRQMYHWIAIFEAENGKGSPRRIMEAKKSKEQEELESLKSRISELEESLRVERLRNRLNEKIIDIAEARWHIEIRKKAGTKR